MYRFFVFKKIDENKFELDLDIINHIKVLRIKPNEKFYCIYNNKVYLCHQENNWAVIEKETNINNEYKGKVVLFASIINIKKIEWLIQKATELGVTHFYPMITINTNRNYINQINNKMKRFIEISKNASEQSFRNSLMVINEPIFFDDAIEYNEVKFKYIAHEKYLNFDEQQNILFNSNVAFYVGPEGGFDEQEINKAKQKNIKLVSLGKRILRAETASIYLLSRIKN